MRRAAAAGRILVGMDREQSSDFSSTGTVVLLHGDSKVSASLALAITVSGMQVLAVVGTVVAALDALAARSPDLFIADLLQPGGNLLWLLNSLRSAGTPRRLQVLVLPTSDDDPRLIEVLRRGADGYYVPGRSASLVAAVHQVLRGESMMTPEIARHVKAHFDSIAPTSPLSLSEPDRRLLRWTAEGFLVNEVARGLKISEHAVGLRMRGIYRKLQFDVRSMGAAIA